jgi:hypothetical protein
MSHKIADFGFYRASWWQKDVSAIYFHMIFFFDSVFLNLFFFKLKNGNNGYYLLLAANFVEASLRKG